MKSIDLNCDIGEGFGNYHITADETIMDYISSANIACGFHAGDPAVMHRTVELAKNKGVAIGAHPGLPDLQGFGRREMKLDASEVYQITLYQIGALYAFVKAQNTSLHHVKAHGALYNMAVRNRDIAAAFVQAVHDFDPALKLYALASSAMEVAAESLQVPFVAEVFADRRFQDDGTLTPRNYPDAVIADQQKMLEQVHSILSRQRVTSYSGNDIPVIAGTICLHGDSEHAVSFAKLISNAIKQKGILVQAP